MKIGSETLGYTKYLGEMKYSVDMSMLYRIRQDISDFIKINKDVCFCVYPNNEEKYTMDFLLNSEEDIDNDMIQFILSHYIRMMDKISKHLSSLTIKLMAKEE